MWRRFFATFLTVTAIGVAIGLALGGIGFATSDEPRAEDRWSIFFALMAISAGILTFIGLLSGFARMSRRETSPFRTVSKIAGAGILGLFFGKMIDPRWKSDTHFYSMLLGMIVAAIVIRCVGDRWFTLGELPSKSPEANENRTNDRTTHPT